MFRIKWTTTKLYNYILSILIISKTALAQTTYNFGTVLFTSQDMYKELWSDKEISLLEARKIFQDIIPSSFDLNEDNISTLLVYFQEAYNAIKTGAKDPETDEILTRALSDVIGGYLKVVILPATRYGYYSGKIQYDTVSNVSEFYNHVKLFLQTDGKGWMSPKKALIETTSRTVVPVPLEIDKNLCDQLEYEKTPKDATPSLPCIHWDQNDSTIFFPFKNQSIFPLSLQDTAQKLFLYYYAASNCLQDSEVIQDFKNKFYSWLVSDIVPHLDDEIFYPGLRGVLGLTDELNCITVEVPKNPNCTIKTLFSSILSKKSLMVIFVVCLEVLWCLSAMIYMVLFKKRPCGLFCGKKSLKSDDETTYTLASDEELPFISNQKNVNYSGNSSNRLRADYTEDSLSPDESSSEDVFEYPLITKMNRRNPLVKHPIKNRINRNSRLTAGPKNSLPVMPKISSNQNTSIISKSERYFKNRANMNIQYPPISRTNNIKTCQCCTSTSKQKPFNETPNTIKAHKQRSNTNKSVKDKIEVVNEKLIDAPLIIDRRTSNHQVTPRRTSKIPKRCDNIEGPTTSTPASPRFDERSRYKSLIPKLKKHLVGRDTKTE